MKKLIALFVLSGAFFSAATQAQVLDSVSDLAFGSFDFNTAYNATIQMATNGNLSVSGSGVTSNGGEAAGHIRITSPDTGIVDVKCVQTAVLSDATATDITIESIEIAVDAGVAFGAGNACNGVGGGDAVVVSVDMVAFPDADIYIGGEINVATPMTLPTDKTYSTGGAGTPIMLSIVVQ